MSRDACSEEGEVRRSQDVDPESKESQRAQVGIHIVTVTVTGKGQTLPGECGPLQSQGEQEGEAGPHPHASHGQWGGQGLAGRCSRAGSRPVPVSLFIGPT